MQPHLAQGNMLLVVKAAENSTRIDINSKGTYIRPTVKKKAFTNPRCNGNHPFLKPFILHSRTTPDT